MIDPIQLIQQYYDPMWVAYSILLQHSTVVAAKAVSIATKRNNRYPDMSVDVRFIYEAAMVHDIGIFVTNTPQIWNYWSDHYLCHVSTWYQILLDHNLPDHARVALTHTWCWIRTEYILEHAVPLDTNISYLPRSLEEQIVSYADLFYIKNPDKIVLEKSFDEVLIFQSQFWPHERKTCLKWHSMFEKDLEWYSYNCWKCK